MARPASLPVIADPEAWRSAAAFQLAWGADYGAFPQPRRAMSIMESKWDCAGHGGDAESCQPVRDDISRELTLSGRIFPRAGMR